MQFLYFMCKTFQKLPNDPFLLEMDPVHRLFFFFSWIEENNFNVELSKNHAYLIGSFINPEAVKKLIEGDTHQSSDEDFDKAFELVQSLNNQTNNSPKNKKRKIIRK